MMLFKQMSRSPKKPALCIICGVDDPAHFSTSNYSRCTECFNAWRRIKRGKGKSNNATDVRVSQYYAQLGTPLTPLFDVGAAGGAGAVGAAGSAGAVDFKNEIERLETEYLERYDEIRADNKRLTDENAGLLNMLNTLSARVGALEGEISTLKNKNGGGVDDELLDIVKTMARRLTTQARPFKADVEKMSKFGAS